MLNVSDVSDRLDGHEKRMGLEAVAIVVMATRGGAVISAASSTPGGV